MSGAHAALLVADSVGTAAAAAMPAGPAREAAAALLLCFISSCGEVCAANHKVCQKHRRVVENMAKSNKTKADKANWQKVLMDQAVLTKEVEQRIKGHPQCVLPYARVPPMGMAALAQRMVSQSSVSDQSWLM